MAKENTKVTTDQIMTEKMIGLIKTAIANGECPPWHKPWFGGNQYCWSRDMARAWRKTGRLKKYSLLNQLFLLFENKAGQYITELAAYEEGYAPKEGEKPSMVFYYGHRMVDKTDREGKTVIGDDGNPEKKEVWFLRYYEVYHVSQMEKCVLTCEEKISKKGKPYKKYTVVSRSGEEMQPIYKEPEAAKPAISLSPIESAQVVFGEYIKRFKIAFHSRGVQAYYAPVSDEIVVPDMHDFSDISEYYSTLYHETVHSTGHQSRLNRFKPAQFGDHEYSKEELVAELGACCCLHRLGISTEGTVKNSQAYLQAWLKKLQQNTKWLSSASTRAEKAVKLIFNESDELSNEGGEDCDG